MIWLNFITTNGLCMANTTDIVIERAWCINLSSSWFRIFCIFLMNESSHAYIFRTWNMNYNYCLIILLYEIALFKRIQEKSLGNKLLHLYSSYVSTLSALNRSFMIKKIVFTLIPLITSCNIFILLPFRYSISFCCLNCSVAR